MDEKINEDQFLASMKPNAKIRYNEPDVQDHPQFKEKNFENIPFNSSPLKYEFIDCTFDNITIREQNKSANYYYIKLRLINCIIYDSIKIEDDSKIDYLILSNCTVDNLEIKSCIVVGELSITNTKMTNFTLDGNIEINHGLHLRGISNGDSEIGQLKLKCNSINLLILENYLLKKVKFTSIMSNSNLQFIENDINTLIFEKFVNNSNINLIYKTENNKTRKLIINNSDLNKLIMSNFILNEFELIRINSSNLNNISFNNSILPEKIQTKSFNSEREIFKQLKNACRNQNDKINEFNMSILEMNAYFKSLSWKTDFFDKLILWGNKWTNNFGKTWIRPLWEFLLINIIFFILTLIISDVCLLYNWSYFFEFINPTHKLDFIKNCELNDISKTIDFISRIFSIILIFQILIPFKKYSKK